MEFTFDKGPEMGTMFGWRAFEPLLKMFFIVSRSGEAHIACHLADFLVRIQQFDLRPFHSGKTEKVPEIHARTVFDDVGEIEGAQMFNLRQILQSDPLGVILIDVVDDSADPFYRDQVAAFEIDDHIALKGKEIKIFLEEFDYIHHEIGAFTLVIEAFDGVMEQNLQQFSH